MKEVITADQSTELNIRYVRTYLEKVFQLKFFPQLAVSINISKSFKHNATC